MKNLHFNYTMKIQFDSPIREHRFTLKCTPVSNDRQTITNFNIDVFPKEFLGTDMDAFGNSCIYGYSEHKHNYFSIHIEGDARTGLLEYEKAGDEYDIGLYKYQTDYTRPGTKLKQFFEDHFIKLNGMSNLDKAITFMQCLYDNFQYVSGVTDIYTTAEEALELGKGVCQDYSHIMISLCRMANIPARYVVGMLIGEGLSHAWVEIFHQGKWIALDPTNNLIVNDEHIKISNGRDYKDCTINQGIFTGQANQIQEISVSVTER